MQGDRYGDVVGYGRKSAKFGGHHPIKVKLDKSGRVRRFHPANLTVIDTRVNPYGPGAKYRHKRLRAPGRFVPGTLRLTKRRRGVRVVVGRLKGERRRVKRGSRKGRPVFTAQAVLTRKGRNPGIVPPVHSERKAWEAVKRIARQIVTRAGERSPIGETAVTLETLADYMLDQLKRGRHVNPTLAVFGNPSRVLSDDVQAVLYRHKADKHDYVHPFGKGVHVHNKRDGATVIRADLSARSGVRALLLDDGSVLLRHPTKRIWGSF